MTDPSDLDRVRRRVLWSMPSGLYVLGSRAGDERNLMTISWVTQVALEPKLVAVSVERSALTHRLVSEGGVFSLCTVARDDRAIVRKFVKPVTQGPVPDVPVPDLPVPDVPVPDVPVPDLPVPDLPVPDLPVPDLPAAITLNGFPVIEAATGAPILVQAVAWLDCRVYGSVDAASHTVFLGLVVAAGFNRAEETPVLRMEDTRMSYGG